MKIYKSKTIKKIVYIDNYIELTGLNAPIKLGE